MRPGSRDPPPPVGTPARGAKRSILFYADLVMTWLRTLANRDEDEGALGRHAFLLGSLVLLLVALPLVQITMGRSAGFSPLLALVIVAAVFVNSRQRGVFAAASVLGLAAVGGLAFAEWSGSMDLRIASQLFGVALLGLTTLVMLNSLIHADQVSSDTIVGGICVYLLVGLCFAVTFIVLSEVDPTSLAPLPIDDPTRRATKLLYFSFVTLTTLGYGDIVPQSDLAQMFAVSEAVIGQLYLTIFVARLVGLYVGRRRAEPTI